ncbi:MAG TPA: copper chaperone PCu(A)C [Acidocella sp.]|jgi:copper(I)-binding protein|nr:copper chaperone PCu(A)C [Acidocella sp.]
MRQLRHLVFALSLAALPAAAVAAESSSPLGQPPLAEMHAQNPWFRLLPNHSAAGSMVLQNTGTGAAILTGASSPDCGSLTVRESNQVSTKTAADITVPAHGSVAFAAGGAQLICLQPKVKAGQRLPFALHFKDGSVLLLMAPVQGSTSTPSGA